MASGTISLDVPPGPFALHSLLSKVGYSGTRGFEGPELRLGSEGGEPPVRPYEVMIVFAPDVEDAETEALLERFLDLLRSSGAAPGTVDRWGRRNLAYEVKHHREGYYVLIDFSAEAKTIAEFDRFLLLLDEVLRHKIVRLPDKVAGRTPAPAGQARGRTSAKSAASS